MVRRETAEHEVGTRLKRNVVALLDRQREIFKMGLAVVARIYPYDHSVGVQLILFMGPSPVAAAERPERAKVLTAPV